MQEIIDKFKQASSNVYSWAAEYKQRTDSKVIGCFPMHIPEEIIHAGGALPITLIGNHSAIPLGAEHLPLACHVARGDLGLALDGKLDFLDGVFYTDICDALKWIPDIWPERTFAFRYPITIAGKLESPSTRQYITTRYAAMKGVLERLIGSQISEASLKKSISVYNQNRELLSRLYEIRRANPGVIKAKDLAAIVTASMTMPKEQHNDLLHQLLDKIDSHEPSPEGKVRLILSGQLCDQPDDDLLDMIESLGVAIADDDLYVGRRYFTTPVRDDLPPIEALVDHYINDIPCATKADQSVKWGDYLAGLTSEAKAKGVVMLILKYCEVHNFDYPCLEKKLADANIPSLMLEIEHPLPMEQMRTRLQAFIELVSGD